MVKKYFQGIITGAITSLIMAASLGNYIYAEEKERHRHLEKGMSPEHEIEIREERERIYTYPEDEREVHKHQEKALAPKHEVEVRRERERRTTYPKTEREVHKHQEKAMAPKHEVEIPFICPKCKVRRESVPWGRTLAEKRMVCPECENRVDGFLVHNCEICGTDVIVCPLCRKAAARLEVERLEEEIEEE